MASVQERGNRHARHLAFQIVAQLPEELDEALLVLEYARRLLTRPLDDGEIVNAVVPLRVVETAG